MEALTIASGKGGVGKTTLTVNLGVSLVQQGKDVILLDADIEMGNLVLHLGMEDLTPCLHEVLAGTVDVHDAIFEGPGGVKVIPAGLTLEGLRRAEPDRLIDVVKELRDSADIVILDAPAGLGISATPALASGNVIPVVNPDIVSISDAIKTKIVAKDLGSRILGTALNRSSDDVQEIGLEEIEATIGAKILAVIPEDRGFRRSAMLGKPIVLTHPDAPASVAIKKFASNVIDQLQL